MYLLIIQYSPSSCYFLSQVSYSSQHLFHRPKSMKINAFWNVTFCSPVYIYWRLGGTCCLYFQGRRVRWAWKKWCEHRDSEFLGNVGKYLSDCIASNPRKQHLHSCRHENLKSHRQSMFSPYIKRPYFTPIQNVVSYEHGDLPADLSNILNWWKNNFGQLFNVYGVNDPRQTEIHTSDWLVPNSVTLRLRLLLI
jgi:hypothetical protein